MPTTPRRRHLGSTLHRAAATGALVAGLGLVTAACGGQNPFEAAATATTAPGATAAGTDTSVVDNVFIPEDQDLGNCVSTLPRPGCGSDARGGWRQYLTMGVLVAGLAFVGWRISIGVRARDAVVNRPADGTSTPDDTRP
ncbi:MAG: hypothetical protein ACO3C1_02705 [Ilumatobacteraceae bacterium]